MATTLPCKIVTDGMKLVPSNPTFTEARDGILAADLALTGGANQFPIWTAFARRGMGFSSSATGPNSSQVTEAFDLPRLARDAQWIGDNVGGDGVDWEDTDNWIVDGQLDARAGNDSSGRRHHIESSIKGDVDRNWRTAGG